MSYEKIFILDEGQVIANDDKANADLVIIGRRVVKNRYGNQCLLTDEELAAVKRRDYTPLYSHRRDEDTRLAKTITIAVYSDGTADIATTHWDVAVRRFTKSGTARTREEVLRDVDTAFGLLGGPLGIHDERPEARAARGQEPIRPARRLRSVDDGPPPGFDGETRL